MTPDEFYVHAMRDADAEGRLPLSRMTAWDVFPFEQAGLRVVPLARPVLPEPVRVGGAAVTAPRAGLAARRSGPMSTGACRRSGPAALRWS